MKRREFIYGLSGLMAGYLFYHFSNEVIGQNKYSKSSNQAKKLKGFVVAVASHCNLNCAYCDTFSPVSKEEFIDYKQYEKDIEKLVKMAPDRDFNIGYYGGEPLIHPDLTKIIKKTTELVPHGRHEIITNGVLLSSMRPEFWETVRDSNVIISVSKYPINLDRKEYENIANKYGVTVNHPIVIKSKVLYDWKTHEVIGPNPEYSENDFAWDKSMVDLEGKQDYIEKKENCKHWGDRFSVYARGNLYYCQRHAFLKAFIEHFNLDFKITKDDYIKIADVKDIKEIDEFLQTPKKLCRYCNRCHDSCFGGECVEWGFTKKDISEWT